MTTLFAEHAFLPEGWARDVRVSIDASGTITAVETDVTAAAGDERLAGPVLPGVADLHSHAFQRAFAGLTEHRVADRTDSFWTWREAMYGFVARLSPDTLEAIAAQLFVELQKGGYTTVCEFHYVHHDHDGKPFADPAEMAERLVQSARATGIGLTLLPVLYMVSNFEAAPLAPGQRRFAGDPAMVLRLVETLRQRHGEEPGFAVGIAPHSLRAVPRAALHEVVAGLATLDAPRGTSAPIHIHIAEQTREVDECVAWSGRRSVEWLLGEIDVTPQWCLVHATHMTVQEQREVARSGAIVGLCPTTEANLGDGIYPLDAYSREGGAWGIGSDSNVSTGAAEELRWLEYAQRLVRRERNVLAPAHGGSVGEALYCAALRGGATAAGQPIDGIQSGMYADLIVLDSAHPALVGKDSATWIDALVFCGQGNPVRDVMVRGHWTVREGHHPQEQAIAARFAAALKELTA
ncbi:MAG: formimidoylglutamate deiminase [Casimicrobiaceae bacterium]